MAVLDDESEGTQLFGLKTRHHRQVRLFPVAEHPESLEIAPLRIDLLVRILPARRTKRLRVDLLPDAPVRFLHLHLDGQPVAIPTRDIGRVIAVQGA